MADFYGNVAGYKAYADLRGWSYAGKTDEEINQALIRATTYIDGAYREQFPGWKTGQRAQALEWPRTGVSDRQGYPVDSASVPVEVMNATYEGAYRELASAGSLNPDIEAGGGQVKREKIGPLEFEYARDGSRTATFPAITAALGSLIHVRSGYSGSVVRA